MTFPRASYDSEWFDCAKGDVIDAEGFEVGDGDWRDQTRNFIFALCTFPMGHSKTHARRNEGKGGAAAPPVLNEQSLFEVLSIV